MAIDTYQYKKLPMNANQIAQMFELVIHTDSLPSSKLLITDVCEFVFTTCAVAIYL